jgi:hypothetical protein
MSNQKPSSDTRAEGFLLFSVFARAQSPMSAGQDLRLI